MKTDTAEAEQKLVTRGMDALVDRLGLADAFRFIQVVHGTSGDYTEERRQWVESVTLEEIMADLARMHEREQAATKEPVGE
jgi:hypothetical protein